jgi:hypothetical protein
LPLTSWPRRTGSSGLPPGGPRAPDPQLRTHTLRLLRPSTGGVIVSEGVGRIQTGVRRSWPALRPPLRQVWPD